MSLTVVFQPDAVEDLHDAFHWYEERRKGLGSEFVQAVDACISSIIKHPEAYPIVYKNFRRALIRKFPYSIFYVIEKDTIMVFACFHFSRHPKHWQNRK
ncbi:MAG: type II toxin-antitoxin system RelE/ParE family toxin [Bacteroidota bacterium]|nr:type II toxin-antitoxin system RelE/ParE family toxin [Bacteroidota bacterium]